MFLTWQPTSEKKSKCGRTSRLFLCSKLSEQVFRRKSLFVGLPLNIKRHLILCGLSVDDGQVHDAFDPYPPPNTKAAYWPDKKLEQELRQVTRNPHEPENAGQTTAGGPTLLNHAWQFFRSILPDIPQVSKKVGLINSKHSTSPITALMYLKWQFKI